MQVGSTKGWLKLGPWPHLSSLALVLLAGLGAAQAAAVTQVTPQGEVGEVRQVSIRFDSAVVPAGDPRAAAPYTLQCNGSTPAGETRWLNERQWVYDLREPLASGQRCTLKPAAGFVPLGGGTGSTTSATPAGFKDYSFATGAPLVLQVQPWPGSTIEEDQHFLLRLNGAPDPASIRTSAWCEVEGLGERMPVRLLEGTERSETLRLMRRDTRSGHFVLLACQRPFAAEAGVRLVWGPGIASAGQAQIVSKRAQRFQWKVRPRLLAEFSCERESARAPCLPLRPMVLSFNAPVPRALALAARLQPAQGAALSPQVDVQDRGATLREVRFAAPLPENMRFKLTLPPQVQDETGRPLANAGSFPLDVATGAMPPLARFAGAPFGIVEAGSSAAEPAMLPLTLRHVQADLQGASTSGRVAIKHIGPGSSDETLLKWMLRLQKDHDRQYQTREQPLLAQEADVRRADLPQLTTTQPRATEVIGVPLMQRGYHVVEVESRILGQALLESKAPMYARTGVLVTNLGVHFKRGRTSSLVWVTTLDRGRPVAGAKVAVNSCRGVPLWNGSTDANGIARVDRSFDDTKDDNCDEGNGLFVTARHADKMGPDIGWVFSRWNRGIEPWRFNIASQGHGSPASTQRAHTVFDRTLLRVGETVSMKHFVREETLSGLALPAVDTLPTEVVLTHVGSDAVVKLPLLWPARAGAGGPARSTESQWQIPRTAALGLYDVALQRGDTRLGSGSFRVEAFRVPLVDARLSGPSGVLVAPTELPFAAQLNALAGGPMAAAPVTLSALLRPAAPQFAGHEEFNFTAARPDPSQDEDSGDAGDGSVLVADKLAATTDRNGAARLVVPKLPPLSGPADLQSELTFTDPNGEVQTVSQRLRLWPAAVVVGLRLPGWAAARGEVPFTALVLSTDGKVLQGRAVQVQAVQHTTISTRKRIVGGFYSYDNRRESKPLGVVCSGNTDAQGRLSCSAKLQVSGEVEFQATAKDDAGRSSSATASAWLSSADQMWFAQDNDDRIDLLPERREVEPGQTARLQVRMPFLQATALVTVEREGVIDARVVTLNGREPVIEVPIPKSAGTGTNTGATWAPNVVVSAFVLRGRLREAPWWSLFTWGWKEPAEWWRAFRYEGKEWRAPTAMVDLAKPSFKLGVAELKVGLADHRLDVKVSAPQPQYGVRETVKATISVRRGGQPLAGVEVAFAAVDEGLLALQGNGSWALLEAMLQPRPWAVDTATAQSEIIGRRHYGRKALPPGGGGGRNPTRELFDTLLLWRGTVVLDAQGQAVVDVPLNDSLTSFRLVAVADAGTALFGTGSTSVRVTQDLQMLSGLSPLARAGDRFDAGFTLRNTTARAMTVTASLQGSAQGAELAAQPAPQTVQLAAGAAAEVRWPVQVPEGATRIDWQASASEVAGAGGSAPAKPAADRLKIVQAIAPAVPQRVWQASLQALDGAVSVPMSAPADALPGSTQVNVALMPSLSGALPGLRRFFETYPYSCLEQKTSRAIALQDSAGWARLREEAAGYLDKDGLAHYFPPGAGADATGSDRLTAYLITAAHEAAMAWPDTTRETMLQGLQAFVEGRIERRFPSPRADLDVRKLAALDALARHGRVQARQLGSIAWTPAAWPTSALLDAWSLYRRVDTLPEREARLDEVQRLIRSRLVAGGTTLKFSTESSDDWWWLMDGPDANAARLLLAAVDAPAWNAEVAQILTGTLARQKRGAWTTTTANLWGVLALQRFAARFESVPVAGRSTVQQGTQALTLDWSVAPAGDMLQLPIGDGSPLRVQHEGSGRPWLTVQTLAAVPLKAPLFAGYRITKTVAAVQRKQPNVWSRGDIVRVRIEVDASVDMSWVVVADPVPAGATLLGSGLGRDSVIATQGERREGRAWPAFEERAADAWRGYFDWMPRGKQVVEYTLRLNTSGRFLMPPTRVEAMYAPETFGERPNTAWEVVP